jgi:predicted dehydrogenase
MIRLGLVDFDTSHVVEFTKRINHVDIGEDQWVEGAKVVAGVPGTSVLSPERIGPHTETLRRYGVPLFEASGDLIGKIDGVLIESVDGSVHLDRARPFLERGMPMFVDKPFACRLADARAMVDLANRTHAPLFSSSSLRYAPELVAARRDLGASGLLGATTHGPAPLDASGRNPGLFHYGIHAVEILYTLLGPGCRRLSCVAGETGEVVTGEWSDGRLGTVRGIRKGSAGYGFTTYGEKAIASSPVSAQYIYRELLKHVIAMFETGKPPLDPRETIEIVAFMESALRSLERGGAVVEMTP